MPTVILPAKSVLEDEKEFLIGLSNVLRGLGLLLLRRLRQAGEIDLKEALGFDYADIAACVEDLPDFERIFLCQMTGRMSERIEAEVFGGGE